MTEYEVRDKDGKKVGTIRQDPFAAAKGCLAGLLLIPLLAMAMVQCTRNQFAQGVGGPFDPAWMSERTPDVIERWLGEHDPFGFLWPTLGWISGNAPSLGDIHRTTLNVLGFGGGIGWVIVVLVVSVAVGRLMSRR